VIAWIILYDAIMSNSTVYINQKAYDIIEDMDFQILDVLRIFGLEVWENNSQEFEGLTEFEVSTAFVQYILDQSDIAAQFTPMFF